MIGCEHEYTRSIRRGYEFCERCLTYRSVQGLPPEAVYGRDYWTHEEGRSTIDEQVFNCENHLEDGVSKYQFVLDRIAPVKRYAAMEIGCAPGRFLQLLKGIGRFECVIGIEANQGYEEAIRRIGCFGGDLYWGLFPKVTEELKGSSLDLIVAMDVFEHSPDPEAWLRECRRLLAEDGQLLMMLPLSEPGLPDRMYEPGEHLYIHSEANLRAMLTDLKFKDVRFDRWCPGHSTVSARWE